MDKKVRRPYLRNFSSERALLMSFSVGHVFGYLSNIMKQCRLLFYYLSCGAKSQGCEREVGTCGDIIWHSFPLATKPRTSDVIIRLQISE